MNQQLVAQEKPKEPREKRELSIELWRVFAVLLCPPLAVIDKGCLSIGLVAVLWIFGWIPGTVAALILIFYKRKGA